MQFANQLSGILHKQGGTDVLVFFGRSLIRRAKKIREQNVGNIFVLRQTPLPKMQEKGAKEKKWEGEGKLSCEGGRKR